MKILAAKAKAGVFDIGAHTWIDIDTPQDLKKAKRYLYRGLGKPQDGWISRRINRIFSTRVFTPLILALFNRITPNAVSFISAAVGIIASLCFLFHQALWGGILAQLASIMDGCDGEIARLKKMQSSFGSFLDALLDRYTDSFIFFTMFVYALFSPDIAVLLGRTAGPLIFTISGLALVGNLMVSYTSAKSVANFHYRYTKKGIAAGRGRDLRMFIVFLGGLLSLIHPVFILAALFLIAVLTNIVVVKRLVLSWTYAMKQNRLIPHKIDAIIFDFDGTLADTMTFLTDLATGLIVEHYEITAEEARQRYLETSGLDFATQLQMIFPDHSKNKQVTASFESTKKERVLDHQLFPEAIPTLEFFKERGIQCFICSSTPAELLDRYWSAQGFQPPVIAYFGLKPDTPKSTQIDSILATYTLQPSEVLFVGDSFKDGEIATNREIRFIGVTRIFTEGDFMAKGFPSVLDLTALTRVWQESEKYWDALEKVQDA